MQRCHTQLMEEVYIWTYVLGGHGGGWYHFPCVQANPKEWLFVIRAQRMQDTFRTVPSLTVQHDACTTWRYENHQFLLVCTVWIAHRQFHKFLGIDFGVILSTSGLVDSGVILLRVSG